MKASLGGERKSDAWESLFERVEEVDEADSLESRRPRERGRLDVTPDRDNFGVGGDGRRMVWPDEVDTVGEPFRHVCSSVPAIWSREK